MGPVDQWPPPETADLGWLLTAISTIVATLAVVIAALYKKGTASADRQIVALEAQLKAKDDLIEKMRVEHHEDREAFQAKLDAEHHARISDLKTMTEFSEKQSQRTHEAITYAANSKSSIRR